MTPRLALLVMFVFSSLAAYGSERHLVAIDKALCPTAAYTSIQAAVNASSPGDTIAVCPGVYPEQLVISSPVQILGIAVEGQDRVVIQPPALTSVSGSTTLAAVTVLNTNHVRLENLTVDASNNGVTGCFPSLAGVHFLDASGEIENDAVVGASIANPASCATLSGNGYGVLLESSGSGSPHVNVEGTSIHDYTKEGIRAIGQGLTATLKGNVISGLGPAGGFSFQFGIFVLNGSVGHVLGNHITEGTCGSLSLSACVGARSEGVVLRAVGDGSTVENNVISRAQSGIFINNVNKARIDHNLVSDITGLDGIDAQGMSNSILEGNTVFNVSIPAQGCGIAESPGAGNAGGFEANNIIAGTTVNDAWCGVAYDPSSHLGGERFYNVTYTEFNSNTGPAIAAH